MTAIQAIEQQIHDGLDDILNLAEGQTDEVIRWKPSVEEWSVMEVLCHVEEVMVYWLNELQSVIRQPGIHWGRGLQDEARLQAIAAADSRQLQDVTAGIQAAHQHVKRIFAKTSESDLSIEAPHRNPKFGTKPMSFLVQHFLIEHLDTHANQIRRVLLQYENRSSS